MNTKLTLRIEDHLIESAKKYALHTGKSVSRIVSDLFKMIEEETPQDRISPKIQTLKGVIKASNTQENSYHRYLEEKHL